MPRFLGTTLHSLISLTKTLTKFGPPSALNPFYEAGPCGYGLVCALRQRGYAWESLHHRA